MEREVAAGHKRPGDEQRRGGREVARHDDLVESQRARRLHRDRARAAPDPCARRFEHELGVVAGGDALDHRRRPLGVQPGEEDRGLHLRARHLRLDLDPAQSGRASDHEGRVPVGGLDGRAHLPQRRGDPLHRPRAQ